MEWGWGEGRDGMQALGLLSTLPPEPHDLETNLTVQFLLVFWTND